MPFDVFIFDFDGTLVDSVGAKIAAYYRLFAEEAAAGEVVAAVLAAYPEDSRDQVIAEMLRRLHLPVAWVEEKVALYTQLTDEAVERAPEFRGATALLTRLRAAGKPVYISSNTPETILLRLLTRRGWLQLVNGAFGHPSVKAQTARSLITMHGIDPGRAVIIGDGASDRKAAESTGARFHLVCEDGDLRLLAQSWGIDV